jgi:hypothetical protein
MWVFLMRGISEKIITKVRWDGNIRMKKPAEKQALFPEQGPGSAWSRGPALDVSQNSAGKGCRYAVQTLDGHLRC